MDGGARLGGRPQLVLVRSGGAGAARGSLGYVLEDDCALQFLAGEEGGPVIVEANEHSNVARVRRHGLELLQDEGVLGEDS